MKNHRREMAQGFLVKKGFLCDFNKAAKQLYWNHTLAWVFPCKFGAYF